LSARKSHVIPKDYQNGEIHLELNSNNRHNFLHTNVIKLLPEIKYIIHNVIIYKANGRYCWIYNYDKKNKKIIIFTWHCLNILKRD